MRRGGANIGGEQVETGAYEMLVTIAEFFQDDTMMPLKREVGPLAMETTNVPATTQVN